MFTGIVKELGSVKSMTLSGGVYRLEVESKLLSGKADIGNSMAVNGVCLTIVKCKGAVLSFDVMSETVSRTGLAFIKPGAYVNLEDPIRAGDQFGGHFVQGHIDCAGRISGISMSMGICSITVSFPEEFSGLIVEKGSVAVDGISLTVSGCSRGSFTVHVIPHTIKVTTLGLKRSGDTVNLEFDIIGKYARRSIPDAPKDSAITENFLKSMGY
jgi:riboflavin synthase